MLLAAVAPAGCQQHQQGSYEAGDDPARRHGLEPGQEVSADGHADQRACHHDGCRLAVRLPPGIGQQRQRRHEIDDEQESGDEFWRGDAACERHEDQRGAEPGKAARRCRDEGNRADRDRRESGEVGRYEACKTHALLLAHDLFENRFTVSGIMRAGFRRSSWSPRRRSWPRPHRFPDRSSSSRAAGW